MGLLVLSDQHLGSWGEKHDRNAHAARACADFAARRAARLCLNGDIIDPYLEDRRAIKPENIQADSRAFSSALRDYQQRTGHPIIYVPGNHEGASFFPEDPSGALDVKIDFDVRSPLSFYNNDVALTHGHLLDSFRVIGSIPAVRKAIQKCLQGEISDEELLDVINGESVHKSYWRRDRMIDGMFIHPYMSVMRMLGEEGKARNKAEARIAARKKVKADMHAKDHSFQPDSMTQNAACLAVALDKRLICVGHDHEPGLEQRWFVAPGGEISVVVANSGSALGKQYTALYVRDEDPAVYLLTYDETTSSMRHIESRCY